LARHLNLAGPAVILMTDPQRQADPLAVARRLPAGSLVVLRHYQAADRAAVARKLARLCRERRLTLLIAADLDLAIRLGTGLHLPEGLARQASARIRLWHRRGRWLTAAAHGRAGLVRAARLGADAALLSPVFPTQSHPGAPTLGLPAFRRLVRGSVVPVYALGGVNARTVLALAGSGAAGVATVSGLD
jgi:thiamine-phosphate pyrophosphorylase